MKYIEKEDKWRCPACGSRNLEYGNTELDGESLGYEFTCKDCGNEAIEWYSLEYSTTTACIDDEDEDDEN